MELNSGGGHVILGILVATAATSAFAVLFNVPGRHIFMCGLVGGAAYAVYTAMLSIGVSVPVAAICAALALTIVARLLAIIKRTPVTVFLLAGIFPLVPGAGIYYTAYYLFAGNGAMASAKGSESLMIAGAISLGILFGSSLPRWFFVKITRPFMRGRKDR